MPVPTFASAPSSDLAPPGGTDQDGQLLPGCAALLPVDEVVAVLGRPLGSVQVRDIRGVPAPSVGRVARLLCRYGSTVAGTPLDVNISVSRYTDPSAATRHWEINSDVTRRDRPSRELLIGEARAVLVQTSGTVELLAHYDDIAVTVVLGPVPTTVAGRAPEDLVTDLAQRTLARAAAARPPVRRDPAPTDAAPVEAAPTASEGTPDRPPR
ncbi:MAG TPA: hypothetical protein VHH34_06950 [Pseudonocardiaceae bacterium]|nr:hypothetical protein [Pseudonocardiaceae bacterium]